MRKNIFIILMVCLAIVGLVSCKNEIEPVQEELVSISFEEGASRALSATLESFDKGNYYWKYAAKKADSSNLLSGQTEGYDTSAEAREAGAQWVNEGSTGLGSGAGTAQDPYVAYKVQGFSQGLWNFTLYAYKRTGEGTGQSPYEYTLVYQGETTGHLLRVGNNTSHSVKVTVSPVQSGNGTLSVLITGDNKITLNPAKPLPPETLANAKIKLGIEKLTTTTETIRALSFIETDYYNDELVPGSYRVTVQFTNDDGEVVYASGSVVATVYSGLTTTVSGNLSEVVTYIEFDAEQNPDIITTTIGTTNITQATTTEITFGTSTDKVQASMPVATAKNLISNLEQEFGAKTSDPDHLTSSLALNLSVDTTEATETTVTYEIGMEATLTYEKIGAASQDTTTTTSTVKNLNDYVTVVVDVASNVSGASVTHSGVPMHETADISSVPSSGNPDTTAIVDGETIWVGFYQYDSVAKKLYIKTKSFSPFEVTYSINEYVAAIGSVRFTSLKDAVAAANSGDEIQLLTDINLTEIVTVGKLLTISFNGNVLTGQDKVVGAEGYAVETSESSLTVVREVILKIYRADGTFYTNIYTLDYASESQAALTGIGFSLTRGYTAKIVKDLTIEGGISLYSNTANNGSVDLNGKTLTITGASGLGNGVNAALYIDGGANVTHGDITIKNGTLSLPGTGASKYGIYNYGTLTLEDLTIDSACETVVFSNGQAWGSAGTTTIDNVTINSTHSSGTALSGMALKNYSTVKPTIIVKDSTITATYNAVMMYAVDATVESCTITAANNNALCIDSAAMASGVTGTVTVKGNTSITAGSDSKRLNAEEGNTISIISGTYDFDPSAYLADGYAAEYNAVIGKWNVEEAVAYADIYDNGWKTVFYSSLDKAIADSKASEDADDGSLEIHLLKSVTADLDLELKSVGDTYAFEIVLDGHTLSGNINLRGTSLTFVNGTVAADITMSEVTEGNVTQNCYLYLDFFEPEDPESSKVLVTGTIFKTDNDECQVQCNGNSEASNIITYIEVKTISDLVNSEDDIVAGYYRLMADIALTKMTYIKTVATIDLNGHSLSNYPLNSPADAQFRSYTVNNSTMILNLEDSSADKTGEFISRFGNTFYDGTNSNKVNPKFIINCKDGVTINTCYDYQGNEMDSFSGGMTYFLNNVSKNVEINNAHLVIGAIAMINDGYTATFKNCTIESRNSSGMLQGGSGNIVYDGCTITTVMNSINGNVLDSSSPNVTYINGTTVNGVTK